MWTSFIVFAGVLWVVASVRGLWPARGPRWVRGLLALVLLALAEQRWLVYLLSGTTPEQVLPRPVLIVLGGAFGCLVLWVAALVVRDLVGLVLWLARRRSGRRLLGSAHVPIGLGLLAIALGAWGTWQGVKVPAVKTVHITLPGLPAAFDGYRIVQLSDLHATRLLPRWWIAAVVRKANALQPDLIVISGDLQDGQPATRAPDLAPLGRLQARDGVLAVPGNHEYYVDYRAWMRVFADLGLHMLPNAHVLIERQDATLAVAGLTDRAARRFGLPGPDLAAATAGIPAGSALLVLSHRPDSARTIARAGALLELAGHTHGGQILGPSLLARWANKGFVSGLYQVGAMALYVSNGTGLWAGLPMRLGRRSEITRIIVHAGPATDSDALAAATP